MIQKVVSLLKVSLEVEMARVVGKLHWVFNVHHLDRLMQELALVTETACALQVEIGTVLFLLIAFHVVQLFLSFLLHLLLQWLECWKSWFFFHLAVIIPAPSVWLLPSAIFSGFFIIIEVPLSVITRFLKVVLPFLGARILLFRVN